MTPEERKMDVEALHEAKRDLESILDCLSDEVYVTDGEGVTLRINPVCEQLYGVPASDLVGRNVQDLEKEGVFFPSLTPRVLSSKKRVTAVQETKTGRRILATANPVFDSSGKIVRIVTVSRDITEYYELKKRLSETEDLVKAYIDEVTSLRRDSSHPDTLVVKSPLMRRVVETAKRAAAFDSTVLLLGESGTGKDTIAQLIHGVSHRGSGPFIKVACGAVPESLMESEFFGYVQGAFTGAVAGGKRGLVELANHGTLFLNEVDCLPLQLQVKILHVIQEHEFMKVGGTKSISADIRIVAASNRDLRKLVSEGRFREDLFYRLNVVPISIPPLRERTDDIVPLAAFFLERLCKRYDVRKRLSTAAVDCLVRYNWPGNIRELENVIERCIVTCAGPVICPEDLPEFVRFAFSVSPPSSAPAAANGSVRGLADLEEIEVNLFKSALAKHGTTRKIAASLGISQSTVVRKLRKLGLRESR